jgi:hypothetical protein
MFKRILLTSVLIISMLAFVPVQADAQVGGLAGYWMRFFNPTCLDTLWAGLGNCDGCQGYEAQLSIDEARCDCCNGGGQCGGEGVPFMTIDEVPMLGSDLIDENNLTARGKTLSTLCWETPDIDSAIEPYVPPIFYEEGNCDQNNNWGPGNCFILSTGVTIEACGYVLNPASGEYEWGLKKTYTGHCDWDAVDEEYDCTAPTEVDPTEFTPCPWNKAPVAVGDSYDTIFQDETLETFGEGVLGNDYDNDYVPPIDAPLTAILEDSPSRGTLTLNDDGTFTYIPESKKFGVGTFTFTYRAYDGWALSLPATVTITVDAPPEP